ncbi:uncharacterized protein LOC133796328 [Humulus lupulus]|uniref:uncharacterized protein LOC133796328 n=1 Tax=Humulus lupulus TaxID=3486 RepID=UPI002B41550C|nr:uncharacterized protein LOC133796328 [Humulus lupulus]
MKHASFFVVVVWALFGFLGKGFSAVSEVWGQASDFEFGGESGFHTESQVTYNYDRIDEVKEQCKSVLSSASELKTDGNIIKRDLFLKNGDWFQVKGQAPIMPFDDRYRTTEKNSTMFEYISNPKPKGDPLNLVSFQVTHVSPFHRSKKSVSISGTLNLAITEDGESYWYGGRKSPEFHIWPGFSNLLIEFQGVYTESENNGGERVVCMLGNAMLPSRESKPTNPWEWVNASSPYSYENPPSSQDDKILLVLRLPKKLNLTSRAIRGQMSSLNAKANQKYFDDVYIVSQLGRKSSSIYYDFTSDKLVSKACDPYPYKITDDGSLLIPGISVYKGNHFCDMFEEITSNRQPFTVLPNWNCSGKDEFCSKLGPFGINKTDGGFKGVSLYIKVVRCEQSNGHGSTSSAKLSVEFRASPPSENPYTASRRSGIGNLTVAAEGIWNSTSGQLCMVGCPGIVDPEGNGCNSRICLYIPTSFSLKQRSIMYGTFSSISSNAPSYFPLSFQKFINHPSYLRNYFQGSHPSYSYSTATRADTILKKNEDFSLQTTIKKSLLKFPKLEDAANYNVSLSLLSEDLTFYTYAAPDSKTPKSRVRRTNIQMNILSLGPLFGSFSRNTFSFGAVDSETETPYHTKAEYTENQLLLNVSGLLTVTGGEGYSNISVLFLEGIYDQRVGKMFLVGCRDVRASWEILHKSQDLEAGLDCLIDVIVSYPSTTARGLVDSLARINIASKRNDDDPLHFSQVKFQTVPITYRNQREDFLSRRGIEGILRILTLSFAIACITAQLFHTQRNTDSVPYMFLVMLGVQAIGYSIPLVTGAEALFKKASSESYQLYNYLESSRWFDVLDYTVKLLVMVSLILTLRLCQKVWKSRVRLLTRDPLKPHRVPSDKKVLLSNVAIHLIGYLLVLFLRSTRGDQRTRSYAYIGANSIVQSEWEAELEQYVGLVQDFFLLPQVIGNLIWQIDCQSLRKLYYIGITLVRLLPHLYDYVSDPNIPYFPEEYEFVDPSMNFYSKFGDVAIPVTAIVLAVLVYVQQKLSYEKLSQSLTFGRCRLLPFASRIYERLPSTSKAFEAELSPGVNGGNNANEKDHDLE